MQLRVIQKDEIMNNNNALVQKDFIYNGLIDKHHASEGLFFVMLSLIGIRYTYLHKGLDISFLKIDLNI